MRFFGKLPKGAKMGGETVDLAELQRQRAKHEAALAEAQGKIAAIEEAARLKREAAERKQAELASLQKKLAGCRDTIQWMSKKVADFKAVAEQQMSLACEGHSEAALNLKGTLAELGEWRAAVGVFKEYEAGLPEKIKALTVSA